MEQVFHGLATRCRDQEATVNDSVELGGGTLLLVEADQIIRNNKLQSAEVDVVAAAGKLKTGD